MSQADCAPTTGERTFVGGNSANPTRRAMLGALAFLPAVIAPIPALAAQMIPAAPSVIDQKIAAFWRQDAIWNQFLTEIYNPATDVYADGLAQISHVTIRYDNKGDVRDFTTADPRHVRNARRWLKGMPAPEMDSYYRTMHQLVEADDAIQARRTKLKNRMNAVEMQEAPICEENDRLFKAVLQHPAEAMSDLFAKLKFVRELGRWDWDEVAVAFTADVDRLSAGGLSVQ